MNRSTLRTMIIVLTIATAAIHWYLVPMQIAALGLGGSLPFILNGLGYLTLLAVLFFVKVPFLAGRETWLHYAYMAFTAVTIVGWVAIGDKSFTTFLGQIGWVDKVIEVVLIGALFRHLQLSKA